MKTSAKIETMNDSPDKLVATDKLFGFKWNTQIPAFSVADEHVPEIDANYHFELETTRAILAGFAHNRRVLVQGFHGTGKSTHIEQVAARLNWPCIRINLDSHVSRTDLIGRDAITLQDGKQVTKFQEGILPWALSRPVAIVFDEYDAGRPDVMFVIQRVLESQGKLTLLDQNRVITPHPFFRIFATANTIGQGDATGMYHGTQPINQGQMDRWNICTTLNYLPEEDELKVVLGKVKDLNNAKGKELARSMIAMANLTRRGFAQGDLSTVMSPRTVINWAENMQIFGDPTTAFRLTFFNKCDENERVTIAEYYQRCFGISVIPAEA
ncbi:MAG: AAA family ATPase [Alphaproteobacteria bacterium]|nr:AAA family ATPase [Alphaproteobacteria bacterium]